MQESYDRRNERLVYTMAGNFLPMPDRQTTIAFQNIGDNFEAMAVYEVDESRVITLPGVEVRANENGELEELRRTDAEQLQRLEAYESHMQSVRQQLDQNSSQNQE